MIVLLCLVSGAMRSAEARPEFLREQPQLIGAQLFAAVPLLARATDCNSRCVFVQLRGQIDHHLLQNLWISRQAVRSIGTT